MPSRRSSSASPGNAGRRGKRSATDDANQQQLFTPEMANLVKGALEASTVETETKAPAREVAIVERDVEPSQIAATGTSAVPVGPLPSGELADLCSAASAELSQASVAARATVPPPDSLPDVPLPQTLDLTSDTLPARMLNEFVYCPRLFYYEHVQGVFVESADTAKGSAIHTRVDKGSGAMPKAKRAAKKPDANAPEPAAAEAPTEPAEPEEIHARSVMLGSERLGVIAKMDLVEAALDETGAVIAVEPVDYKAGSPREGSDGATELWDTDRMQLGLQCLVLRDNGYRCEAGLIYYRGTKQRVRLELTPELEAWVLAKIAAARAVAAGPIPPPLIDSPKCVRCSLAPVCLPDETHMLSIPTQENPAGADAPLLPDDAQTNGGATAAPRRLMAPRDEKRALYLNTQGFRVGCNDAVLKVKEKDRTVEEVRVMDICHVALFGNIQVSTQAVQRLCDCDIPVTWFSMGGWFYGITRGHSLKNVQVRIAQFKHAADPVSCLRLAQQFVRGKIHNHRVLFMRNHVEPPERTKLRLGQAREDARQTSSLEELLGVEGAAAAVYFEQFGGMLREREEDEIPDVPPTAAAVAAAAEERFTFDFTTRNRRPPTDPVNALLSLAYSLLAKECTLAAYAVGLDPYVGFYHQPRHGRPALALDVMEEFRPLIAESAVLTAINNRFISIKDFVTAGRAVNLNPGGRKQFFQCFEQRMNALVTHPVFDYKVSYRRALELQFRILARVLAGEIPEYIPFLTR